MGSALRRSAASFAEQFSGVGVGRAPRGDGAAAAPAWDLANLAGRFVELSSPAAGGALTAAMALLVEAQLRGEPGAWIAVGGSIFYPPDAAGAGIDLDALAVVRLDGDIAVLRAAEHLLRSGGFAVVVLDLGERADIRLAAQSRLAGLAQKHRTVLLCLTRKRTGTPSIGSLVSVRGEVSVSRVCRDRFRWQVHVIKDKRRAPGWRHAGECRGPDGMR